MEPITIQVQNMKVTYEDGGVRDVKITVNGEVKEERQNTWFMHALLEETSRLKEENRELKKKKL